MTDTVAAMKKKEDALKLLLEKERTSVEDSGNENQEPRTHQY